MPVTWYQVCSICGIDQDDALGNYVGDYSKCVEIERKFLVKDESWKQNQSPSIITQAYLSLDPVVRVRIMDRDAFITVKGPGLLIRTEFEYEIPVLEACGMLELAVSDTIQKKRYHVGKIGNHDWVVDVFGGSNRGLVLAEIELTSEDEEFELPPWCGKEVTNEKRYTNVALSSIPSGVSVG